MSRRPASITPGVVGAIAAAPRPSAVIANALGSAREVLAAREADLKAARAAYEVSLDEGREAALAARARLSEAEVDADIARRQVAKLEAEGEQARDAERRAETDRLVVEADAAVERYRATAVEDWPVVTAAIRGILRLRAEAELAANAARAAIAADPDPSRHTPCPGVDAFRTRPGRPREVLDEPRELELWTNGRGEVLGDGFQARMHEQADGSGLLRSEHNSMRFEHKRVVRRVRYLPAEAADVPDDLAASIQIPGLAAGDPAGWLPRDEDPRTILRLLDALEATATAEVEPDVRQPRIDLEPVGDVIDVVARRLAEREAARQAEVERRAAEEAQAQAGTESEAASDEAA